MNFKIQYWKSDTQLIIEKEMFCEIFVKDKKWMFHSHKVCKNA